MERQKTSGKKADALVTTNGRVQKWIKAVARLRLG